MAVVKWGLWGNNRFTVDFFLIIINLFNMKKIILLILVFLMTSVFQICGAMTISGGISASDRVPTGFFGNWKVMAVRVQTSNMEMFAPYSVEMWNLSKNNDVITLTNPVSGASASITVKDATSDTFTFQRVTGDKNETVTETAKLTLKDDNFVGIDTMVVRTYKNGMLVKTENVEYKLKAAKISGSDIRTIFGVR